MRIKVTGCNDCPFRDGESMCGLEDQIRWVDDYEKPGTGSPDWCQLKLYPGVLEVELVEE